ncbi:hypothetical protein OPIT5_10990 [Opitutaceae bacterium TAV5]|nr:hypothetical protein OPIT5_10990 [Opitutaceae bacterium TAV5]
MGVLDVEYNRNDGGSLYYTFGVASQTTTSLTFDNGGSGAKIKIAKGNAGNVGTTFNIPLLLADNLTITNDTTGLVTVAGGITASAAGLKTITVASGDVTFSSVIGDGASQTGLTHNGGTVILSADNNYTGGTSIGSGSTLQVGTGGITGSIMGDVTNNGILVFNRSDEFIYAGDIAGTGDLVKRGGGKLNLTGENSYTGDTSIEAGTLSISSDGNLGNGGDIVFNNGSAWAQLELTASLTTDRNIELNGTLARIGLNAGRTFTVNGDVSGTGGLMKRFAGTLVLNGTGSYAGTTTVEGGTLIVNGDFSAATGNITVNSGNTLGGIGTLGGAVNVSGWLAPGNSIGTLSTGSLSLGATSILDIELGRSAGVAISDRVNVTGTVSIANGANLNLTVFAGLDAPMAGDIFWLVINDGTDAVSGVFTSLNGVVATSLNEGSLFFWNGQGWRITYQADLDSASFFGGNDIAIQAVPELSVWALIAASFSGGFVLFRSDASRRSCQRKK